MCLVIWAIVLGSIGAVLAVPLTACCKIALHNIDHPYAKVGEEGEVIGRSWMPG